MKKDLVPLLVESYCFEDLTINANIYRSNKKFKLCLDNYFQTISRECNNLGEARKQLEGYVIGFCKAKSNSPKRCEEISSKFYKKIRMCNLLGHDWLNNYKLK